MAVWQNDGGDRLSFLHVICHIFLFLDSTPHTHLPLAPQSSCLRSSTCWPPSRSATVRIRISGWIFSGKTWVSFQSVAEVALKYLYYLCVFQYFSKYMHLSVQTKHHCVELPACELLQDADVGQLCLARLRRYAAFLWSSGVLSSQNETAFLGGRWIRCIETKTPSAYCWRQTRHALELGCWSWPIHRHLSNASSLSLTLIVVAMQSFVLRKVRLS